MPRARDPDPQAEGNEAPELRSRPHRARVVRPATRRHDRLEEAVCEAVFRYQLRQPLADAPRPLCYYLAWQGRDPDDAFLRRLRALAPNVQPLSCCRVSARDGVVDRVTGGCGVIVQVTRLTWVHAAAVDVVGGYYLTHRQAAGLRYHVEHDGRHWAVTAVHLLWRA
jgi:hypothetical protein